MKCRALLLVAICIVSGCSGATSRADEDPATVGSKLIARLRTLALKGDLFEPETVTRLLDMNLKAVVEKVPHLTADCGDGTGRWAETTRVTESQPSWYHALPSGAGHMQIPGFTINPATATADPAIEYHIYHSVYCRDWPRMRDHREAHLWLTGLPAFTCLTPDQIKANLPEARRERASDGVDLVNFEGRIDDDFAIVLTFSFRAGAPCAISAELRQDQEYGYRYRRAQLRYEACRAPSDREFCAQHSDITWSSRDLLREMVIKAYERCGTVDTFYVREPRTGVPAPPLPLRVRQTPCDGR